FRDATAFGWINFGPIYELLRKSISQNAAKGGNAMDISPSKVLDAVGLSGLKSVSLKVSASNEGILADAFLAVPEASRTGLFKILAPDNKDAAPPAFVA